MPKHPNKLTMLLLLIWWGCFISACAIPPVRPTDPKTPDEQMLMSQAIKRGLQDHTIDLPAGSTIWLDYAGHFVDQTLKGDFSLAFAKKSIAAWLSQQGAAIVDEDHKEEATLHVQAMIQSLGTRRGGRLLGIPASNSFFLPISIPEIALWKRERRQGYFRFYLDVYDRPTRRLVQSTEPFVGSVAEITYTAFFFIRWKKSELDQPLEIED